VSGKVQSVGRKLSNAVWVGLKTLSDGYGTAAKTISGHFPASGGGAGELSEGVFQAFR